MGAPAFMLCEQPDRCRIGFHGSVMPRQAGALVK